MTLITFDTLGALADHVQGLPTGYLNPDSLALMGGDYDEAIKLAHTGWPEGVARARDISERISSRVVGTSADSVVDGVVNDVSGADYDMGAYLSGVPEMWIRPEPVKVKRAVRIVSNCSISYGVTISTAIERGTAISALALTLQAKGYPVTVDLFYSDRTVTDSILVRLADAATGSPLDVDRLVYALANPMVSRGLIRATINGKRSCNSGDRWGHGTPASEMRPPGEIDVFVPGMLFSQQLVWDERWVLAEYLKQSGA